MSVCLSQWTGDFLRAGILFLWFANLSLAPSTINTYCLTNCPNSHSNVRKPLKDILLLRVACLILENSWISLQCVKEGPGMVRGRDSLPPKRQETQAAGCAWWGKECELPSSRNSLPVFHFIFSPNCLAGGDMFLIKCRRGYCIGFCGNG